MCGFKKQKKALTFYSQSLICHCNALVLLSFIILPYQTSASAKCFLLNFSCLKTLEMKNYGGCAVSHISLDHTGAQKHILYLIIFQLNYIKHPLHLSISSDVFSTYSSKVIASSKKCPGVTSIMRSATVSTN